MPQSNPRPSLRPACRGHPAVRCPGRCRCGDPDRSRRPVPRRRRGVHRRRAVLQRDRRLDRIPRERRNPYRQVSAGQRRQGPCASAPGVGLSGSESTRHALPGSPLPERVVGWSRFDKGLCHAGSDAMAARRECPPPPCGRADRGAPKVLDWPRTQGYWLERGRLSDPSDNVVGQPWRPVRSRCLVDAPDSK